MTTYEDIIRCLPVWYRLWMEFVLPAQSFQFFFLLFKYYLGVGRRLNIVPKMYFVGQSKNFKTFLYFNLSCFKHSLVHRSLNHTMQSYNWPAELLISFLLLYSKIIFMVRELHHIIFNFPNCSHNVLTFSKWFFSSSLQKNLCWPCVLRGFWSLWQIIVN